MYPSLIREYKAAPIWEPDGFDSLLVGDFDGPIPIRTVVFKDGLPRSQFTIHMMSVSGGGVGTHMTGALFGSMTGIGVASIDAGSTATAGWYKIGAGSIDNVQSGVIKLSGPPALFAQWVWSNNTETNVRAYLIATKA